MAGRSWGHTLRKLTPDEIETLRRHAALAAERWPDLDRSAIRCHTGKCRHEVTHETSWSYVTGRAGRVSSTRRRVCDEHAAKFRANHDLPDHETGERGQ